MEEADKDWMMIRMVGGYVFLLVLAHPGSPGQRATKRLLLLCCCPFNISILTFHRKKRQTISHTTFRQHVDYW